MAVNGVYIVLGEANTVVALLNKARRQYQLSHQPPSLEDTDPLLRNFADLKEVLNSMADIADMNPLTYLSPFLDVIKAQNTNGPITEAALSSVAKFLSYGLIDASSIKASNAVESIAYAVVHTKFIGGKSSGSDECVLFKILHVLRSLLLSPPGSLLSNEAVCDLMQSCFRIVFEQHLSPLLRKAAESTLSDMTQLIFTRLPTFREDTRHPYIRKLVMNSKGDKKKRRRRAHESNADAAAADDDSEQDEDDAELVVTPPKEDDVLLGDRKNSDGNEDTAARMGYDVVAPTEPATAAEVVTVCDAQLNEVTKKDQENERAEDADSESDGQEIDTEPLHQEVALSRHAGLQREASSSAAEESAVIVPAGTSSTVQMPYGLPCCRELLRFLIALTNPLDRQNTEPMVVLGLNLITVALEAAADHLSSYSFLMPLIKDNLCRSLLQLLDTEKLPVLAATNRACFLLFESMRSHLKFQLESYFHKLKSLVLSEQRTTSYEQKEMALESLVQLWRIPGLVTELYLNYDCDLYCTNVFEELTKLLVDMSFPVAGLRPASLLSLDALLVVIDTIDQNCVCRQAGAPMPPAVNDVRSSQKLELPILSGYEIGKKIMASSRDNIAVTEEAPLPAVILRANRHAPSEQLPSMGVVIDQKKRKRIFAEGAELFNESPKKGIEFLREKGLLGGDAQSVVQWLRSNHQLDKKKIADYICNRKNADVLSAFVQSFPFENTRLDHALRMFLESFRLPGEAAEISMVIQHFSEQWYKANNEPFNHVDAAFTLSYAVIMLNMDQHNPQVKRNQPPMTANCFKRNVSGTNDKQDFDSDMLDSMYNAIRSEEIVMPAEQTGLVKENYLWNVLLRRGETSEGVFSHAPTGWNDHDLFALTWGPAIAALSYVFDKTDHDVILKRSLNGYRKCASIAAHYGMKDVFDNLVIHLCKFSTLTTTTEVGSEETPEMVRQRNAHSDSALSQPSEMIALAFGENHKAQEATRVLFELVHQNGDILREGWRNMLDVMLYLFRAQMLPPDLTEVDDFVDEKGWVSIVRSHARETIARNDTGLLSWFGLGGGASETDRKKPTAEQQSLIKLAINVIAECRPSQLVSDSKYLTSTALSELLTALTAASGAVIEQSGQKQNAALSGEHEDGLVFYLEVMIAIALENKDRLDIVWPTVRRHLEWLLSARFGRCPVLVERAVVGLLRVANRNLFRDNTVADDVLHSLSLLLRLSPKAMFVFSRQIAFGLHDILRNNAANVHKKEHWQVIFSLMEAAGAALLPEGSTVNVADRNAISDGEPSTTARPTTDDRGYTSDNPQDRRAPYSSGMISDADSAVSLDRSREWIHLDHGDAARATQDALRALGDSRAAYQRGSLVLATNLGRHEPAAFLKVCECLAFLLRDAAHVTPDNFESSVQCLRTMIEASLDGGRYAAGPLSGDAQNRLRSNVDDRTPKRNKQASKTGGKKELSTDVAEEDDARKEEQQLSASYQQVSLQLLDLSTTLHSLAPGILIKWAQANPEANLDVSVPALWQQVWRPLLQAVARLGCDCRRMIRAAALTNLQRAFLPSNMGDLGPSEWESCFGEVLFPLLTKLLEPFSAMDPIGMEDTRVRAIQIVAKTLLNHLTPLSSLASFPGLWLRLLDAMEQYLRVDSCGNLNEAVPESLKNMLLVLDNTGLFSSVPGLHHMTTTKMGPVLPQLIKDIMPPLPPAPAISAVPSADVTSLAAMAAAGPRTGRVQIAPAMPAGSSAGSPPLSSHSSPSHVAAPTSSSAPVEIPEVPLTEVIVHSGAASPVLSPQFPSSPVTVPYDATDLSSAVHESASAQDVNTAASFSSGNVQSEVSYIEGANAGEQPVPMEPQHQQQPQQQYAQQPQYQQQYYAASPSDQQQHQQQYYHQQQPQHVQSPTAEQAAQQQAYYQQQYAQYYQQQQYYATAQTPSSYSATSTPAPAQQSDGTQAQYQHQQQQQQYSSPAPAAPQAQPQPPATPVSYPNQQQQYSQSHQQQATQQYMPQADLAKVFAATQVPQFVPPAQLLQSTFANQQQQPQYSLSNPLPLPSMTPIAPSAHSAFSQVGQQPQPTTHQSPYHFAPIQSPPQERP